MGNIIRYKFLVIILMSLFTSCGNEKKEEHAGHSQPPEQQVYTCPMHPEIIRNAPGSCPICGMALVKKETGNKAVQNIALEALLQPANEFVVSTIPVVSAEQRQQDIALNVVGTVTYDTRQTGIISSRVKGRIERLYIRYKYQPVKKGQRIMDIYSPELVTAQQNLLFLLRNDPDNNALINAAKERLVLMGMTSGQVSKVIRSRKPEYSVAVFSNYSGFVTELNATNTSPANNMQQAIATNGELSIREGMYLQSGQAVFSVYNPSRAWILLDIYPEQQSLVKKGDPVSIVPETAPAEKFRARIDYLEPIFRQGAKTLSARVYFNNAAMQLPVGSRVTASIMASSKNALWLPQEAVVSLGRDKIVFLKESGGFRAHKIITGMQQNNYIQVTNGLSVTDSMAIHAQYLMDNEAFIKANN